MSAIVAVYNRAGEPVEHDSLARMLAAGAHRAVDGQDVWFGGNVALAHQHFWITPEEQGEEQPLLFDGGRLVITFDGRLDNRPQLLDALHLRSPDRTLTDAELTLYAYLRWKQACVDHLLGDFAFAVWDEDDQQLFVARDPLGVRQVCYYDDGKRGLIASTVSQILAHPDVRAKLNEGTIAEYLVGYEWNQHESHFEGLYFVPPGHCLLLTTSGNRVWRYWHPDLERQLHYRDSREYGEEFLALIADAVRARLRCVGEVGISLSGGLDSTTIAAIAHSELEKQGRLPSGGLRAYSYIFDEYPECDERRYIQPMVEMYDLNSTYIQADNVSILGGTDIPMLSLDYVFNRGGTYLPWMLLQQMHRDGCRIQLTGGYGDMLYDRQYYWAADLLRNRRWRQLLTGAQRGDGNWMGWNATARSMIRPYLPDGWVAALKGRARYGFWHDVGIPAEFAERTELERRVTNSAVGLHSRRPGTMAHVRLAHWNSYVRMRSIGCDWAARLGIEISEPFRDRRLVEFSLALPAQVQGMPGRTKDVLRRAMAGKLPNAQLSRPDKATIGPWIEGRFWQDEWYTVKDCLAGTSQIVCSGYIRASWLQQRLALQTEESNSDLYLWRALMLEIWLQNFGKALSPGK